MKPLKFQQVQDAINAITTDWSIRGPFHEDDGKFYAMLHGEWVGGGYLNKRLALDAIYSSLSEGGRMSKPTYEELEAALKELRRIAFSARRNSHNCGPFQYSDLCEEIIDITVLIKEKTQ